MKTKKILLITIFTVCALFVQAQNRWKTMRISDDFSPKNDITAIQFDKGGEMWVGTSCGIFKNSDNRWLSAGLSSTYVQTLYIDRNHTKWAGLWGMGLYKSTDGVSWNSVTEIKPAGSINVVTSDLKGKIWIGDWHCGAYSFDGNKWISSDVSKISLGDHTVTSIISDLKNNIWFGTYHGVTVYNEKTGKSICYNAANGKLPENDVYALCSDNKNNVWVGTVNGLVEYGRTGRTIYKAENSSGLLSNLVLSLAYDPSGYLWVGTERGICRFDGKRWINYTVENSPLIDNRIQTIKIYDHKVYIGTSRGISVLEYH